MKIIKAKSSDSRKISSLIINIIKKINAKDYKKKQLEHELSCYTNKKIKEYIKKDLVFIIKEKKEIIGVITFDSKKKTINSLYVKPTHFNKGIGKKLMKFVEDKAKKKGIKKLILYPTKFAIGFYKKLGYKVKRKFIGTENGGFPVIEMEKILKCKN